MVEIQRIFQKQGFQKREQVQQKIRMFQAEIFACNRLIFLDNANAMWYDIV